MQNEYLGNFNLNPTNSSVCKTQTYNKTKSNTKNNNNNNSYVKNNNTPSDKKNKKDEYVFKDSQESEDGSRDKTFQSSEESNASGLQIILEKEESLKGNSEDSQELPVVEEASKKKSSVPVETFEEEAVDSFCVTKLLRNKHKSESKKQKKKLEESFRGEKRRKSAVEVFDDAKKKCSAAKRRKSVPEEYSLKREAEEKVVEAFSVQNEDEDVESLGNLKNEALRKVFVTKDKPETTGKRKDGEVRKKKRKKSKHHEGETKKRKTEMITSSPSIMSFAKDALKFKFKLTPNKPTIKVATEEEKKSNETHTENGNPEKEVKKSEENESKKLVTDKERLLHLRAVRHKAVVNKTSPKNYINTPPSLTISKIDSSEQQPVKSTLVESRPSLEITLVSPTDSSKTKKVELNHEPRKEVESPKVESSTKEIRQRSAEVVDNFGVLDLSEKSTRTKENNSNSSSPKEVSETVERRRKSTHQSILHIAQTLVNRKLSPILPENHLGRGGFEGSADSSATAAAMRNLKTLSDTAVNILMAAQSKNFPTCATELQKRSFSAISSAHKSLTAPNSTKPGKDCENGSGLKIPIYPGSRERSNPIPPIPNLHEIYPRGRGRPLPLTKPSTPAIKPGQNQTVRQIPNPFVVLNRQTSQNQNSIKSLSPPSKALLHSENGEDGSPAKQKLNSIPPLQSIKTKLTVPKLEDLKELNAEKNGSTEFKGIVPKIVNNNTKTVQNGSESNFFGLKNGGEERKSGGVKLNNNTTNSTRKIENMAKNIESVAAGLTARAVSNAMIDAK